MQLYITMWDVFSNATIPSPVITVLSVDPNVRSKTRIVHRDDFEAVEVVRERNDFPPNGSGSARLRSRIPRCRIPGGTDGADRVNAPVYRRQDNKQERETHKYHPTTCVRPVQDTTTLFWKLHEIPFQGRVRDRILYRVENVIIAVTVQRREVGTEMKKGEERIRACHCSREFFNDQKRRRAVEFRH